MVAVAAILRIKTLINIVIGRLKKSVSTVSLCQNFGYLDVDHSRNAELGGYKDIITVTRRDSCH